MEILSFIFAPIIVTCIGYVIYLALKHYENNNIIMTQKYPGSKLCYSDANSTVVEFGIALLNYSKFSHKRANKEY